MKSICALLVLFVLARAQIPNLGWCPDYLPMNDFEVERFLGKWYESERYFQFSELGGRCVITDYAKAPSGKIYVSNEITSRITGVKRIIAGNLEQLGKGGEGKLKVKYTTTPFNSETTLTVLDTDYDNYAVVWSCNGFGPIHTQSAWLMTRDRLAPGTILQRAYGVLDKYKISRTFFLRTDQEGCALAASDINAANGISPESTVPEATGAEQKSDIEESSGKVSDPEVKPLKVVEHILKSAAVADEHKPTVVEKKSVIHKQVEIADKTVESLGVKKLAVPQVVGEVKETVESLENNAVKIKK